jgi:hypothetical protein
MAEELLRGPERDADAIGRADQMTSRLRLDGGRDALRSAGAARPPVLSRSVTPRSWRERRTPNTAPRAGLRFVRFCPHATIFSRGCAQKAKNQLQQSRGAPNVVIEARENSRIDNRRRGMA